MEADPENPRPPFIPPPDLSPPPPPPPSPLDGVPASARSSISGPPPLQVRVLEDEAEAGDGEVIAPFNSRVIAAIIDMIVASGVAMAVILVLPSFAGKLGWLVSAAYMVTRDSVPFLGGQSVGKKAMKLRAVTADGRPLTGNWEAAILRNIILLVPFLPLVELFVLLTREDKPERGKRLGDEWAKTKVIVVPAVPPGEKAAM